MSILDPLEPRRLFAATLDTTFGVHGHAALPAHTDVLGVLATHGSVFVDAYNTVRQRRLVYKYTAAGTLDTAWGGGGYQQVAVVPRRAVVGDDTSFSYKPLTLRYDARAGDLLAGIKDGGRVNLERLDRTGRLVADWGAGGVVSYAEPDAGLTLGVMTAYTHRALFVGLDRSQSFGPADPDTRTAETVLLKLDGLGRPDRTFGTRGVATAVAGHYTSTYRSTGHDGSGYETGHSTEDVNEPHVTDLQVRSGGLRVIDARPVYGRPDHLDRHRR